MIAVVQRAFAKMEEEHCRVVTRYMGSRKCRDQESPPRDLESQREVSGSEQCWISGWNQGSG